MKRKLIIVVDVPERQALKLPSFLAIRKILLDTYSTLNTSILSVRNEGLSKEEDVLYSAKTPIEPTEEQLGEYLDWVARNDGRREDQIEG